MELIVIVLLIARALSRRRLELFKRTTKIIADNINTTAPKMPSIVPRNGLICRNVGARTGEIGISENGKTTEERRRRRKKWRDKYNRGRKINKLMLKMKIFAIALLLPVCLSGVFSV